MKDDQQIRFSGEGDQEPDLEAGDIVVVLDEKPHDVFRRSGQCLSNSYLNLSNLPLVGHTQGFLCR